VGWYLILCPGNCCFVAMSAGATVGVAEEISKGRRVMKTLEQRKLIEAEFHDLLRDPALQENPELYAKLTSNKKWYSVARKSRGFAKEYLRQHSRGAKALDYACGDGLFTFQMAEAGADAFGIDISPVSVSNAAGKPRSGEFRPSSR
jgi:2-polyprenyl-3-methyl-5-hydroxy-6-metoxy-1,4-benzoquinol methylase